MNFFINNNIFHKDTTKIKLNNLRDKSKDNCFKANLFDIIK